MVKIEVIEFFEDYLSSDHAPMDVRGKYHHNVLSEWVGAAMKALIQRDEANGGNYFLGSMAKPYTVSVVADSPYYKASLPFSPLGANSGVLVVYDDAGNQVGITRNGGQRAIMNYLKSCGCRATLQGKDIVFDSKPGASSLVVHMVPEIKEMDDEDDLNFPDGMLLEIADIIIKYLLQKRAIPQDKKNDQNVDE